MANGTDTSALKSIGLYLSVKVRGDGISQDFKWYPLHRALEHLNELIALKYDDEIEIVVHRRPKH